MRKITWYCGDSWEDWGPNNLSHGIAGSQQAVIYLSNEWAKLGHKVTIFNRCGAQKGIHDGVKYRPFQKFNLDKEYDVLILWREKTIKILDHSLKAKCIILDLHDIPFRKKQFGKKRLENVDKILVKSKFHKKKITHDTRFKFISKKKLIIIQNGTPIENLPQNMIRKKYKMIYASNYTRGLEFMLKYGWEKIKKEIPNAELHIFYGWGQYDSYNRDEKSVQWKKEMINLMSQTGVYDHGRVSQHKLLEEKASSVIHYYGCTWPETDCISVRESASVGCLPVTTRYGPLGEKKYCVTVNGKPEEPLTQEKLAKKILQLLKNQNRIMQLSKLLAKEAKKDSWRCIARKWEKFF